MAKTSLAGHRSIDLPCRGHVSATLKRILESADFLASERNKRFLAYVVEETLAGRADLLKAYNIAIAVFGRDPSFDPQTDPLVRIEAGKLRRELERYYFGAGRTDPLRISIPKGCYRPVFEHAAPEVPIADVPPSWPSMTTTVREEQTSARRRSWLIAAGLILLITALIPIMAISLVSPPATMSPSQLAEPDKFGPTLLVLPLIDLSSDLKQDYFARGLTEEIIATVTRFKSIQVFADPTGDGVSGSASQASPRPERTDYVLKGSVRRLADRFRVTVHLIEADTGKQLWTESYDRALTPADFLDVQSDIAVQIAAALGHPYSVLFTHEAKRIATSGLKAFEAYDCVLKIYAYWETLSPARHRELRDCHELAVTAAPAYADAWVNLAWLYIDEYRFDYNYASSALPPLDRAVGAARTAVAIEQDNARAHLVLAVAYWFRQDFSAFDQEAEHALSLNPNDATIAAELGLRFFMRGDWERAQPLLDRALARTPSKPHLYRAAYALRAYQMGDYDLALREAESTRLPDHPVILTLVTAIYGEMGHAAEAREAWDSVRAKSPGIVHAPRFWMLCRGLSRSDTDKLMQGLDKAGVLSGE